MRRHNRRGNIDGVTCTGFFFLFLILMVSNFGISYRFDKIDKQLKDLTAIVTGVRQR